MGATNGVGEFINPNQCQGGWGGGGFINVGLRLEVIEETVNVRVSGSSFASGLSVSLGPVHWLELDPDSFSIDDQLSPGSYQFRIVGYGKKPFMDFDVLVEFTQE